MNAGWLSAGLIVACLLSFGAGWEGGASSAETKCALAASVAKVDQQSDVIDQQVAVRVEEDRRNEVAETVSKGAEVAKADVAAAAVGADDASSRLLVELEASKRRFASSQATCNTRVDQQRTTAQTQYDLLARLYQESDAAQGRLAQEAESYRLAGLACQQQYEGVRNKPRSIGEQ